MNKKVKKKIVGKKLISEVISNKKSSGIFMVFYIHTIAHSRTKIFQCVSKEIGKNFLFVIEKQNITCFHTALQLLEFDLN